VACTQVQELTIHRATNPKALTMVSFIREHGQENVVLKVFDWLQEIDLLSGGRTDERALALIANMVVNRMKHRSVASVLMALRDGFSSTDKDAKVYGSITWPSVAIWLDRHEEKVLAVAHETHASKVVKGDNYGSDWLNAQEAKSAKVQDRKDRIIEGLKRKLDKR
jgi:hypothetical protein